MKAPEHYSLPFYIVRHAESTLGAEGRYAGGFVPPGAQTEWESGRHIGIVSPLDSGKIYAGRESHPSDVAITEKGEGQARAAAEVFRAMPANVQPTTIYRSMMRRTEQTAEIIHQYGLAGAKNYVVPLLGERNWGDLLGKPKASFPPEPEKFGGELAEEYSRRVHDAVSGILAHAEEHREIPLLAAHKGTMQALLGRHGCALPKLEEERNCAVYRFTPRAPAIGPRPPGEDASPWIVERAERMPAGEVEFKRVKLEVLANAIAPGAA